MTPEEFEFFVIKLETVFNSISKKTDPNEEEREKIITAYYSRLENVDKETMGRAIDYLYDNHETKAFPAIKQIRDAINEITGIYLLEKEQEIKEGNVRCFTCDGIGAVIRDKEWEGKTYPTVIPCSCKAGEIWIKRWKNYLSKKGFLNVGIKNIKEIEEEAPY